MEVAELSGVENRVYDVLKRMKEHSKVVKASNASTRIGKLKKLRQSLLAHQPEIRKAMHASFRKPDLETDMTELLPVIAHIDYVIKNLSAWLKPEHKRTPKELLGAYSYVVHEPKGVVLILGPWNYAFNLIFDPLVSAIAAGNCILVKPSELTPEASQIIRKIIKEVFHTDEINIIEGDAHLAASLTKLPFDHIFFTGSPAVGKMVMKAASENLTSVTLELGGKSPAIVHSDADINKTASSLVFAKFLNTGQTCIAPDYVLVHRSVKRQLIDVMVLKIQSSYGNSESKVKSSKDFGRIVSENNFKRIESYIKEAISIGATINYGGHADINERYIEPTIITNVEIDSSIMQNEIFGPVLPVLEYQTLDEAYHIINALPKPLACYIFSNSHNIQQDILSNTTAGGTTINDCLLHNFNPNLPFGGINNSGIGKGRGLYGFYEFSNARGVLNAKSFVRMSSLLSAPYSAVKYKIVNILLRYF